MANPPESRAGAAVCALALIALLACGTLLWCSPDSVRSPHRASAVAPSALENQIADDEEDLVAVATLWGNDHMITADHVGNVLKRHGIYRDWFCGCAFPTTFSSLVVRARDEKRAARLLEDSLRGLPFRGTVGTLQGNIPERLWRTTEINARFENVLGRPEFSAAQPIGRALRKHGNTFSGFGGPDVTFPFVNRISQLERRYFSRTGWDTAQEYRVVFATDRSRSAKTQEVNIQVWNAGKSVHVWETVEPLHWPGPEALDWLTNQPVPAPKPDELDSFFDVPPQRAFPDEEVGGPTTIELLRRADVLRNDHQP